MTPRQTHFDFAPTLFEDKDKADLAFSLSGKVLLHTRQRFFVSQEHSNLL